MVEEFAEDHRDLKTFAADVWPLVEDMEPGRWAGEFLDARQLAGAASSGENR